MHNSKRYTIFASANKLNNHIMAKKKFEVVIAYHGSFSSEVYAENEREALDLVRAKADSMSAEDFLMAIEVIENGTDVSQIKEK